MPENFKLIEIILFTGISQALFSAVLILGKKDKSTPDRLLAGWLIILAIEFFTLVLDYRIIGKPLLSSSFLLINPACYLYVKSLTQDKFAIKPIQLLHLIPFLFFEIFAYVIRETISLPMFFAEDNNFWFRLLFGISNILSWLVYNFLIIIYLHRHRKNVLNEYSTIDANRNLIWIFFIVVFYNVYWISLLSVSILSIVFRKFGSLPQLTNYSLLLIMIYVFGFYGLRQKKIYTHERKPEELNTKPKYQNSLLTLEQKADIKSKIIAVFEHNKPYLNPEFNMEMLSEITGVPKHYITEVLNTELNSNFFSLVNAFRVNAVKESLSKDISKFSIEAIGYECGFNSKSAFFTVFKKFTGKTPLEWKSGHTV